MTTTDVHTRRALDLAGGRRRPIIDIYARVSRASDKDKTFNMSTEGQTVECETEVRDAGYEVGEKLVDKGKSAWDPKRVRPGWERLMARLESGEADGVIVFDMSRFARRMEDGLRLLRVAEQGLIVMDSEGEYDLSKPKQAKNFRDAISDHEYESAMIGERTKRGKRMKARDRKEPNCSTRAFGYQLGNVKHHEAEAAELRLAVKRMLDEGWTQEQVCEDWNARGIATAGSAPFWRPTALRATLLRPGVVGDIAHNGEILHVGAFTGVLDRETYNRLQAMYATRRRGRPATSLSSGFILCSDCLKPMHARDYNARRGQTYPDGSPARVYICTKRYGTGCSRLIDQRALDAFLIDLAIEVLSDPQATAEVAAQASAAGDELTKLGVQIAEVEANLRKVDDRWTSGGIGDERHAALTAGFETRLKGLQGKQRELIATAPARTVAVKAASRKTWEKKFAAAGLDQQREWIGYALRGRKLKVSAGLRMADPAERVGF